MRRPTVRVRLSGRTVTSSDTTRRPPILSDSQQNTAAAQQRLIAHNSPYTWSHVLSWCRYQASIWGIPIEGICFGITTSQ